MNPRIKKPNQIISNLMKKRSALLYTLLFLINLTTITAKTIKVTHPHDRHPYSSVNENGESVGILIDWWKLWAQKSNVAIQFIPADINNCIKKTLNGEADVIAGLFYNEERSQVLSFSDNIMRVNATLFLKKGHSPKSLPDINFPVVIIKNDPNSQQIAEKYPELKTSTIDTFNTLKEKVADKELDGFIYDLPNPRGIYKSHSGPDGYYQYHVLISDKLRPAVKKGNQQLLDLILAGSSQITDDELANIAGNWNIFKKDQTVLKLTILFIILLLVTSGVFYFILRRQRNKAKTGTPFESGTDWQIIIDKGENDYIEFKSSLRWDYREEKPNKALEQVIVKTISAFLNTNGGMLFIGVDDDGNTLGLEKDYQTLKKNNRDGFMLTITNLINQYLGKTTHRFLTINIISINDKDVCIVSVEKCNTPVFLGKNGKEEFYIRASASSQPLSMKETYEYISSNWDEK
ncbi:hypothetical protein DMA11_16900 [Marinilabiliaceae bacterium JC017]|nr:hypothetical protein DMA11_16900 [Marinilabiliaceae bacterium JC017]